MDVNLEEKVKIIEKVLADSHEVQKQVLANSQRAVETQKQTLREIDRMIEEMDRIIEELNR